MTDKFQALACAIAYESHADGRYDWSEPETSYGGGGVRVDREKLSKIIAYALAHAGDDLAAALRDIAIGNGVPDELLTSKDAFREGFAPFLQKTARAALENSASDAA